MTKHKILRLLIIAIIVVCSITLLDFSNALSADTTGQQQTKNFSFSSVVFAAIGSLLVKLLDLAELHQISPERRPNLRDWVYWIPFLILPFVGAVFALAYQWNGVELNSFLALHIGASSPLIAEV